MQMQQMQQMQRQSSQRQYGQEEQVDRFINNQSGQDSYKQPVE